MIRAYFPNIYDVFKVLFIDLFVQLGDLASDFAQGYFLILDEELFYYGICTFVIHWVPGIVASIHCISTKRAEYGVSKTLAWAGENTCENADYQLFSESLFCLPFYLRM